MAKTGSLLGLSAVCLFGVLVFINLGALAGLWVMWMRSPAMAQDNFGADVSRGRRSAGEKVRMPSSAPHHGGSMCDVVISTMCDADKLPSLSPLWHFFSSASTNPKQPPPACSPLSSRLAASYVDSSTLTQGVCVFWIAWRQGVVHVGRGELRVLAASRDCAGWGFG